MFAHFLIPYLKITLIYVAVHTLLEEIEFDAIQQPTESESDPKPARKKESLV